MFYSVVGVLFHDLSRNMPGFTGCGVILWKNRVLTAAGADVGGWFCLCVPSSRALMDCKMPKMFFANCCNEQVQNEVSL
jgi:hypothetical protein